MQALEVLEQNPTNLFGQNGFGTPDDIKTIKRGCPLGETLDVLMCWALAQQVVPGAGLKLPEI